MKSIFLKAFCGFLSVLFVFSLIPFSDVSAAEFICDEELFYGSTKLKGCYMTTVYDNETQSKTAIIKADKKLSGDYIVPALSGKDTETYLWAECFSECDKITSVTVPAHVKFVSVKAFSDCSSLERIVFLSGDTFIYDHPGTITEAAIICAPENSSARSYAEKYGRKFEKLDVSLIPADCGGLNGGCENEITEGIYKFAYCSHYNEAKIVSVDKNAKGEIDVPEYANGIYSVVEISADAFRNCVAITRVNIGAGILSVGKDAFAGCSSLSEAHFSNYDTEIYDSVNTFPADCRLLSFTELYSGSTAKAYAEKYGRVFEAKLGGPDRDCGGIYGGCFYPGESNGYHYGYCPHYNSGSVTAVNPLSSGEVILPSCFGETEIFALSADCMKDCSEITSLIIPETIDTIDEYDHPFFDDCSSLTQITFLNPNCEIPSIPAGVTVYGFVNSTAQNYADENNLEFVSISSDMYDNSNEDRKITVSGNEKIKAVDENIFVKSDITINELLSLSSNITEVTDKDCKQVDASQKLCSGMVLICKNKEGIITDSKTVVLPGDNDGNGKISAQDARLALRASVKLESFNDWQIKASDVEDTGKNNITASDARFILRASVGLESTEKWYDDNINSLSE